MYNDKLASLARGSAPRSPLGVAPVFIVTQCHFKYFSFSVLFWFIWISTWLYSMVLWCVYRINIIICPCESYLGSLWTCFTTEMIYFVWFWNSISLMLKFTTFKVTTRGFKIQNCSFCQFSREFLYVQATYMQQFMFLPNLEVI